MIPSFSFPLVQQMVEAAAAAYVHSTVSDPRTNAQANVTLDPAGNIVVAFKGSSEPADFLQDAKFAMTLFNRADIDHDPAVKVHTGFLEDFNAIKDAVVGQVRKCMGSRPASTWPASPGVFITGHSLGGALAIFCALECWRQALPVSGVYTFGQPRVGNAAFAALYDRTRMINGAVLGDITFRVVNQNDIVPRTPGLLLGYRHGGTELFLPAGLDGGSGTGWQLNPGPWLRAWSDLLGLYGAWRHRRDVLVSEHFLSAYCRRIHAISQT
jgi:hypothetical protein